MAADSDNGTITMGKERFQILTAQAGECKLNRSDRVVEQQSNRVIE
ncbi:hypothetical protein [Desulfosporosinus fructosivorans]|nr:hypothetical protein [Desulfosporosinus fructosivorans]